MRKVLRMADCRKSLEDRRVKPFCQCESLSRLGQGRHDGVAGIAEFPGKDGEGDRGPHVLAQARVQLQAGASQLVQIMGFFEGLVVRGQKGFQVFSAACWQ